MLNNFKFDFRYHFIAKKLLFVGIRVLSDFALLPALGTLANLAFSGTTALFSLSASRNRSTKIGSDNDAV